MAREYARIRLSIAADRDVEALTPMAQWLYFRVLIADPKLSQCGVTDWRPNRLLGKAAGLTLPLILLAAAELESTRFALFDTEMEEVLVRAYIRSEELMRNPKMAVAVASSYLAVASRPLKAVIVSEVLRDRKENPDYSTWNHSISRDAVEMFMGAPGSDQVPYVDAYANAVTNTERVKIANGIGNRTRVANTNGDPGAEYQSENQPDSLHIVPTSIQPVHGGGYVSRERNESPTTDSNGPFPNRCPKHTNDPSPPACGGCADARRTSDELQAALAATTKQLIADCPDCDEHGWALDEDGLPLDETRRCEHPTLTAGGDDD